MLILVVNTGSSSIKYQLFEMTDGSVRAAGVIERIGEPGGPADHGAGVAEMLAALPEGEPIAGVGHRVVHGGEALQEPVLIDDEVLKTIAAQIPLAPLHNPANLRGIEALRVRHPEVPQVAVFDTAFHATLPPHVYRYAVPESLYLDHGLRRYGFHGTSVSYVVREVAAYLDRPAEAVNVIVAHLGNGASITAVEGGRSVETSMGLTPLEGLVMGTRSGDLDPAAVFFLARQTGMSLDDIDELLNKGSGLKGMCGDNDMREVVRRAGEGDAAARLALDVYVHRIRKYVGAYLAVLGRTDALVFTAGVGQHSAEVRARVCARLDHLGIRLDAGRSEALVGASPVRAVHAADSPIAVLVVPTNEELEIAEQTAQLIQSR